MPSLLSRTKRVQLENTKTTGYHPEPYWSEVADRIEARGKKNVMAGDDSPFYRYKRERFLNLLHEVDLADKHVLEIGSGPGGNLLEVIKRKPASLSAADISASMINLAQKNTAGHKVNYHKIDGQNLPMEDQKYDVVFSATVLQHNSDEEMMKNLLREMCRVSGNKVILFERVEPKLKGDDLCVGRPVDYYADICKSEGFELTEAKFINIQVSYLVSGAIRKLLNPPSRKEGQKLSFLAETSQKITLPITKLLDKVITPKRDLARITLTRK